MRGKSPPESEFHRQRYDAAAVLAVFPPVILTMLLAVISAKTWMWDSLKGSDSGVLSAKYLEGEGGGEKVDTTEIVKVSKWRRVEGAYRPVKFTCDQF